MDKSEVEPKPKSSPIPNAGEIWDRINWSELRPNIKLGNSLNYDQLVKQIEWLEVGPKMQHYLELNQTRPITIVQGNDGNLIKTAEL